MKKLLLKSLFFVISVLIFSTLIGSITYPLGKMKQDFIPYMIGYYKFFLEFLGLVVVCGGASFLCFFFLYKLYKKIFEA